MLADIDTDADGNINFEEFNTHMLKLIEKGSFDLRPTIVESGVKSQMEPKQVAIIPEVNSDIDNSQSDEEFQDALSQPNTEMREENEEGQGEQNQVGNSDIVSNDNE